jgi:hypothetical protein
LALKITSSHTCTLLSGVFNSNIGTLILFQAKVREADLPKSFEDTLVSESSVKSDTK